jgi:hypothetical protein
MSLLSPDRLSRGFRHRVFYFIQEYESQRAFRPLLGLDLRVERAFPAIFEFLAEAALHPAAAKGAGHDPAGAAAIRSAVSAVQPRIYGGGTCAQRRGKLASRLSSALFEFPTVDFHDASPSVY